MVAVGAHLAQGMQGKVAVLLVNLGSPDAPTKAALKRYLREFLSDPRVVDLPRWQWFPILYGVVLQTRPKKSAHAYEAIWQENGSPLIEITKAQVAELGKALQALGLEVVVDYAMRYGNPSLTSKFMALKAQGVEHVLVVPMYPQYSDATTASVFDGVALAFVNSGLFLRFGWCAIGRIILYILRRWQRVCVSILRDMVSQSGYCFLSWRA